MKTIRDAVHGDLRFTRDELEFVDTPTFQRLRGIKQVGTSNLVYPSAVHTRFEHSLGTAWLAKQIFDSMSASGHQLGREDVQTSVLAALLHDVTHVPFGHTIEDERRLLEKHDRDPARLEYFFVESELGQRLARHPLGERVRSVLQSSNAEPGWIRQVVSGTVCADLLDYLKRDAYHCGLRMTYDDRLFQYFSIVDGQLVVRLNKDGAFRHDVLSELIHLLQFRYTLTERVYYHHAKVTSGAMISRAVELALASRVLCVRDLYSLRDDALLDRFARAANGTDGWSDLVADLLGRQLYRRAYRLVAEGLGRDGLSPTEQEALASTYHSDVAGRQAMERQLAQRLGVPEAHIIIYCPSPRMQMKEADVPVEITPGKVEPLSALGHPDVDALSAKHRGLWTFYVLVRRHDAALVDRARAVCEEEFGYVHHGTRQSAGPLRGFESAPGSSD